MRIGLLSDTHGYMDEAIKAHLQECDEIWHAGDIGNAGILRELETLAPVRAVYGNIDGQDLRSICREDLIFSLEDFKVIMTHIGGYPGRYTNRIRPILFAEKPDLFICGHSHILKIINDKQLDCLHINPGASGQYGFHQMRTLVRFTIKSGKIDNLQVVELGKRGAINE